MSEQPGTQTGVARVNFDFRRELAQKLEGDLSNYCYQCGACVGDCPAATYSGSTFNPREIMLKVLYGLGEELLTKDSILWQCTNCYNCYEHCPQQVKPVEVIISLKNMMADRGIVPPTVQKIIGTFEETGRTAPLGSAIAKQRVALGLPALQPVPMDEIHAIVAPTNGTKAAGARRTAPRRQPAPARTFAFFPGCLIPARFPAMEFAIRQTLSTLGITIVDLEGTSCCPDPIYFKSKDKISWLAVAARNLSLAEDLGLDVVTNCSGCTATLAEAHHLLQNDALRARVNDRLQRIGREYRGTSRVRHIVQLLRDDVGYDAVKQSAIRPLTGLRVAIHYGCHLLKPSRVMAVDDPNDPVVLEKLVAALGATPVRHRNWSLCCGKACQDDEIPAAMMRDVLQSVAHEHADILCLICPTCFTQFDYGQLKAGVRFGEDFHTPSVYYAQLLAFAQGVPYDRLGFDRQRFKPESLRRLENGAQLTAPGGGGATVEVAERPSCVYCGALDNLVPDHDLETLFYCQRCWDRFARHSQQIEELGEAEPPADDG
jgi:heterodisulfide reductase subunit B